jgi:hypothetical protein
MAQIKSYENRQAGYTHRYRIKYEQVGGIWKMYCLEHPHDPYGKGGTVHHMEKGMGGWLCQRKGYESTTFEHAEAFAHWWMARFSIYVTTGNFPMTRGTFNVPD